MPRAYRPHILCECQCYFDIRAWLDRRKLCGTERPSSLVFRLSVLQGQCCLTNAVRPRYSRTERVPYIGESHDQMTSIVAIPKVEDNHNSRRSISQRTAHDRQPFQ